MPVKKPLVSKDLLKILACPVCKGDLKLVDLRGKRKKEKGLNGQLVCKNKKCSEKYPIKNGIPILLPPALRP